MIISKQRKPTPNVNVDNHSLHFGAFVGITQIKRSKMTSNTNEFYCSLNNLSTKFVEKFIDEEKRFANVEGNKFSHLESMKSARIQEYNRFFNDCFWHVEQLQAWILRQNMLFSLIRFV